MAAPTISVRAASACNVSVAAVLSSNSSAAVLFSPTRSASVVRSRTISRRERAISKETRPVPASSSAPPVVSMAISISFRRMEALRSIAQGPGRGLETTRVASRRSLELIRSPARSADS